MDAPISFLKIKASSFFATFSCLPLSKTETPYHTVLLDILHLIIDVLLNFTAHTFLLVVLLLLFFFYIWLLLFFSETHKRLNSPVQTDEPKKPRTAKTDPKNDRNWFFIWCHRFHLVWRFQARTRLMFYPNVKCSYCPCSNMKRATL